MKNYKRFLFFAILSYVSLAQSASYLEAPAFGSTADSSHPLWQATKVLDKENKPYQVGDSIIITDGQFKNFEAVIREVNLENHTVKAALTIFGRLTIVEFDFVEIRRL